MVYQQIFVNFFLKKAVILTILIFAKEDSTKYDYSGTIITLVAIIFQTICAYLSVYRALKNNNLKIHKLYYYSKFPYLVANIYERIVVHILSCQVDDKQSSICQPAKTFAGVLAAFIVWNIFEAYLILIVYCFCLKVKRKIYDFLRNVFILNL